MGVPLDRKLEVIRRATREATQGWPAEKRSMAIRAAGLDRAEGGRKSLDAIAADLDVSRETVRRARNELLAALDSLQGIEEIYTSLSLPIPSLASVDAPATARALRRLLTMTGALRWDEVLSAWARAGAKPPYSPLPTDATTMRAWAAAMGGFKVSGVDTAGGPAVIDVVAPEGLDQVSQFLLDELRGQPGGVDRNVLLELAGGKALKPTTIATALSGHPAVMRVGRATWALRGIPASETVELINVTGRRRVPRARPTTFSWDNDGSLRIDFSIPRGPSPVIAVPKAVARPVEGREFAVKSGEKPTRISVRNARLWGFGSLIPDLGLTTGGRVSVVLNLIAGTAIVTQAERKEPMK